MYLRRRGTWAWLKGWGNCVIIFKFLKRKHAWERKREGEGRGALLRGSPLLREKTQWSQILFASLSLNYFSMNLPEGRTQRHKNTVFASWAPNHPPLLCLFSKILIIYISIHDLENWFYPDQYLCSRVWTEAFTLAWHLYSILNSTEHSIISPATVQNWMWACCLF